jgi:prevent-host-death family protein
MPKIRPVSDLRNHFAEISRLVHEEQEPVFITKKGYGDMVVMSMEQYECVVGAYRIDNALRAAEEEALRGDSPKDFREVAAEKRRKLAGKLGESLGA